MAMNRDINRHIYCNLQTTISDLQLFSDDIVVGDGGIENVVPEVVSIRYFLLQRYPLPIEEFVDKRRFLRFAILKHETNSILK